ncbi:glycosyltransferase family 4 protein [Paenibacillus shenyangensis]|uniref:glycosyltransferase family 4 protein n=1 Tax=Paenibacillus sp. A9 TaxID=1284352 RepID=UPI0003615547|nr:glycosyltransferase family 4 protein [Paenibacillus sp. A9]
MKSNNGKLNIGFLGTSLPRECGLATFSHDMMSELGKLKDFNNPRMIAVNNSHSYTYGDEVIGQIRQQHESDYIQAAQHINAGDLDLLVIQHEFGIYGGTSGEYLLQLAEALTIPFVVIFHTVLAEPDSKQRMIMNRLGQLSNTVVTMAQNKVDDLINVYDIASEKIKMYHHGVPFVDTGSRSELKERYGYTDRNVLSTFGFLSPGKGIEYVIEAMKGVIRKHPEALYIIWGKTHPNIKQESGEIYREKLMKLISKFGLEQHVQFVDKHLTQEEVVESLVLSDIYLTPYLGKDQAVSGTLAYGVGYGRVIISTPYRYAVEMLADGRGLLAKFHDSASLEKHIIDVLDQPDLKADMESKTLKLGNSMRWSEIAKAYSVLFREVSQLERRLKGSVV